MSMRECETVEVKVDGQEYVLRELKWGEKNAVTRQCFKREGKTITMDMDLYDALLLEKSIVKAPFPVDKDYILSKMPARVGDKLFEVARKLNGVTSEEEKDFLQISVLGIPLETP